MRLVVLMVVALAAATALAGCGDGTGDGSSSSTEGPSSGTTSGTTSSHAPLPTNRAPTGRLVIDRANGTAPASFNVSLNGSDPDGDALAWNVTFGDGAGTNGTALPANVTHAFAGPGNFTVLFRLSDGNLTAAYNATVVVTEASAGPATVFVEAQSVPSNPASSGQVPGVGYAGGLACAGFLQGESGVDCVFFELDAALAGHAFTVTSDAGDPDLEFWASCDPSEVFAAEGFNNDGPESGLVPEGALCIVVWAKLPPDTPTHTVTIA